MLKSLLAGTAALAIAGTSLVYAQQTSTTPQGPGAPERAARHRFQPTPEDRGAFLDARVAALKTGLKLTPDQEKNWPAFEKAYRDFAKLRTDRAGARREAREQRQDRGGDPIERLARRADNLTQTGTALKQLADAAEPLYKSLDDAQKRRFVVLSRAMRPHQRHFAMWRAHRGGGERGDMGARGQAD
ncbi:MAG TPA: Spy/CpxP family protein refolding chaperone [Xanthobacteraceae bacterium]|nr:Spy/CpxP family protein refolding chaperone [Xanthobacteraceae bacterium]